MADDLHGALKEVHAISKATRCTQYLFSVSLNPPEDMFVSDDDFRAAADRIADKMNLTDQPRAIVTHEKNGRRHAHAVWSRIDADEMKAVPLPHFKMQMRDVARDLHLENGWALPEGMRNYGQSDPLNFTLSEWQQARRIGADPRELKPLFQEAWAQPDDLKSQKAALSEKGLYLAKGDRRGVVALDIEGNVYALARWTGIKSKEVKARLGSQPDLQSLSDVQDWLRDRKTGQVKNYIKQIKDRHGNDMQPFIEERAELVTAQRSERAMLKRKQEERWIEETKARSERLNKGLRGLFDRLTGTAKATRLQNETEAVACAKRDQDQRNDLIRAQMAERKTFQRRVKTLKAKHSQDRKLLAQSIIAYLKRPMVGLERNYQTSRNRMRNRSPGLDFGR